VVGDILMKFSYHTAEYKDYFIAEYKNGSVLCDARDENDDFKEQLDRILNDIDFRNENLEYWLERPKKRLEEYVEIFPSLLTLTGNDSHDHSFLGETVSVIEQNKNSIDAKLNKMKKAEKKRTQKLTLIQSGFEPYDVNGKPLIRFVKYGRSLETTVHVKIVTLDQREKPVQILFFNDIFMISIKNHQDKNVLDSHHKYLSIKTIEDPKDGFLKNGVIIIFQDSKELMLSFETMDYKQDVLNFLNEQLDDDKDDSSSSE